MQSALPTSVASRLGYLLILLLLPFSSVHAQTGPGLGSVTGRVHTAAGGIPIQFANVTLHRAADSVAVKTEFSDAQGDFRLEHSVGGPFLVSVTQIGFTRYWSPAFPLTAGGQNLATIALQASKGTQLKEVTIVKQKPLYERLADRTIVNLEGSALVPGNTALDVLSRAPSVTVGSNDNLALRGRQGLLVLIDGKRQPMTGTELSDYLRALPAEQLSSIELITNPPSKYDAQGGAGIIAINLKKDQRQGTNGTANVAYGRGQYGKFTSGLSINHRSKTLNAFGSYTYTNREGFEQLALQREFYQNRLLQGSSNQDNYLRNQPQSHTWRAGLDYTLSKRSLLGAAVSGVALRNPSSATNTVRLLDAQNQPQTSFRAINDRMLTRPSVAANLNFKHTFADSSGSPTLNLDADYGRYSTGRTQALTTFFEQEPRRAPTLLSGTQDGELTFQSLKADYTSQLPRQVRIEAGAKATLVRSDNDIVFVDVLEGIITPNLDLTNRFRYNENINAAYVTLTRTTPKLTLSAGLRGEQTNVEGQQEIGNEAFDRNYFQLFPSAQIERTLSDKHTVGLALGRRINRPTYNQLNPFRSFVDATSYRAGNPNLRPETSYNIDLTHTFDQKYVAGLSYVRTEQVIVNIVQPDPDNNRLVLNQDRNLRAQHYYALTLTAPLELSKGWNVYNNAVIYYAYFVGSEFGTDLNRGRLAYNLSTNSNLTLAQDWTAELSASYQSRERYGFQDLRSFGQVTAGVQKSLWTKKASLRLSVADIFYTTPLRVTSTYDNFVETYRAAQDSRVATLSFTYRFGNDKLPPTRKRTSGAEDEKRRAQ